MSELINGRPTTSFWLVGGAALIWNLFGMIVYVMQVTATPDQLAAQYSPEQVALIQATPKWAISAFATAVTTGVLGCLFLLLRKSWAVPMFIVSLLAVVIQNLNTFVLNDSIAVFGMVPVYIQFVITLVGVALIWYSRRANSKGWLD